MVLLDLKCRQNGNIAHTKIIYLQLGQILQIEF